MIILHCSGRHRHLVAEQRSLASRRSFRLAANSPSDRASQAKRTARLNLPKLTRNSGLDEEVNSVRYWTSEVDKFEYEVRTRLVRAIRVGVDDEKIAAG
jgi:hypothetical protein